LLLPSLLTIGSRIDARNVLEPPAYDHDARP
jgi:hypothetical protein